MLGLVVLWALVMELVVAGGDGSWVVLAGAVVVRGCVCGCGWWSKKDVAVVLGLRSSGGDVCVCGGFGLGRVVVDLG